MLEYCCLTLTGAGDGGKERQAFPAQGWAVSVPLTLYMERTLQQLPGSKERGRRQSAKRMPGPGGWDPASALRLSTGASGPTSTRGGAVGATAWLRSKSRSALK